MSVTSTCPPDAIANEPPLNSMTLVSSGLITANQTGLDQVQYGLELHEWNSNQTFHEIVNDLKIFKV